MLLPLPNQNQMANRALDLGSDFNICKSDGQAPMPDFATGINTICLLQPQLKTTNSEWDDLPLLKIPS